MRRSDSRNSLNQSGATAADAEGVINNRLLTFRDVDELQKKNIELLAVVRELSSNKEAIEDRLVQEKMSELRQELEMAMQQVEELRAARQRQEVMVESIIVERDMYKSIADNADADKAEADAAAASKVPQPAAMATSTPGAPQQPPPSKATPSPRARAAPYHELEKKATAAAAALEEVQKEFGVYRTEKCENERMLNEELKVK